MSSLIKIAVDAMGGDNSPEKIINGIIHHHSTNKDIFYKVFGEEEKIIKSIGNKISKENYQIVNTSNKVSSEDSPLEAAKRGKDTSMWLAIESVKKKDCDIVISAGNTGALLVISKLNLKMIENIDKPALSALWPNKKGMSVVLDLGANIECDENNLSQFAEMGSALYRSLFPQDTPKVSILNIGSEEIKGTNVIKKTNSILQKLSSLGDFNYVGYVEGNKIMDGETNVIVTDGFTGNVALKTAEGTAKFLTDNLKKIFNIKFDIKNINLIILFFFKKI